MMVALAAALLAAILWPAPTAGRTALAQAGGRQKFEYKIIAMPKVNTDAGLKEATDAFNRLGDEGWDLAASESGFYYIFKRPK
jgi:hypothetical protein